MPSAEARLSPPPGDFGPPQSPAFEPALGSVTGLGTIGRLGVEPKGDAPTASRTSLLKSALLRAKTRADVPRAGDQAGSPAAGLALPAPLAEANDSRQKIRQVLLNDEQPPTASSHRTPTAAVGRAASLSGQAPTAQPETRPRRTVSWDSGVKEMEANLRDDEEAAKVAGVWQTDSSQHTHQRRVTGRSSGEPTLRLLPQEGRRSLRVLYLFSGVSRRASIAESLKDLCTKDGFGLEFHDVDIHVGGSAHDLLDKDIQEVYMSNIQAGEYDVVILSPPCGSWSRASWANDDGPAPCRDRFSP